MPRVAHHRRFTANHTWHVDLGGRRLFVKLNPHPAEAAEEVRGHTRLREHYPVPELVAHRRLGRWRMLVYQRQEGIGPDRGLLLDEITHAELTGDVTRLNTCLDDLLAHYRKIVQATLTLEPQRRTIGKLYAQRALPDGRLDAYYGTNRPWLLRSDGTSVRPSELAHTTLVVNERTCQVDFSALVANLRSRFTPNHPAFAAVTQGDPTDVNLGWSRDHGLVWFDYDTGGLNALAGEFACFLTYQRLHGAWLTPKYHPTAYTDHPATLTAHQLNQPTVHVDTPGRDTVRIDYRHQPSPARRLVMRRYLDELVQPVTAQLGIPDVLEWLRPYLIMRLLGVYNLTDLAPRDTALSLGLLAETLHPDTHLEGLLGLTRHQTPDDS